MQDEFEKLAAKIKAESGSNTIEVDLDRLISIKGQLDVVPCEIIVESKDVINEYDFGHFKFIRTKKAIVYRSGGYDIVISPRPNKLYGTIEYILNIHDRMDELTDDERATYNSLFPVAVGFCNMPMSAFIEDRYTFEMYGHILKCMDELNERLMNKPLQEDDAKANAEFDETVAQLESLKKDERIK